MEIHGDAEELKQFFFEMIRQSGAYCGKHLMDYCEEHKIEMKEIDSDTSAKLRDQWAMEFAQMMIDQLSKHVADNETEA